MEKYKHFQPGPGRGVVCVWAAVSCSILDHNWAMLVLLHWRVLSIQQTSNDAPYIGQIKTSVFLVIVKKWDTSALSIMVTSVNMHSSFGGYSKSRTINRDITNTFVYEYIYVSENHENWMLMPWLWFVTVWYVYIIRHTDGIQSGTRPEMYLLFVRAHPLMA